MGKILKPRTKFFIHRQIQLDVIMHVLIFLVGLFIAQIFCGYFFINRVVAGAGIDVMQELSAVEFISRYKTLFLMSQLIPVSIFLLLGIYYFGRMTQKIVGPLFNIQRSLRRLNTEGLEKLEIKLREDDYFQELAQQINTLISSKK